MSSMTWGQGCGHYEDMGNGQRRYTQPQFGESYFRGRAGVVIEVAPQRFVSYTMTATYGEIDVTTETEDIRSRESLAPIHMPTSREVHMVLTGQLGTMDDRAERPAWATAQGEIEARRAIGGRP